MRTGGWAAGPPKCEGCWIDARILQQSAAVNPSRCRLCTVCSRPWLASKRSTIQAINQRPLKPTFEPTSRVDVPKPNDALDCAELLTCTPNPERNIRVLGSEPRRRVCCEPLIWGVSSFCVQLQWSSRQPRDYVCFQANLDMLNGVYNNVTWPQALSLSVLADGGQEAAAELPTAQSAAFAPMPIHLRKTHTHNPACLPSPTKILHQGLGFLSTI